MFLAGIMAFSCGKKDEKASNDSAGKEQTAEKTEKAAESKSANKFIGKWEIIQAEGDLAEMNKGVIYEFTADEMSTSMAKGKYTTDGDTLIVNFEGLQVPFKYIYKWEGEKLKLDVLSSGGQKFVLEKK